MTHRTRVLVNNGNGPAVQGNHNFVMGAGSQVTNAPATAPEVKKSGLPELLTRWLAVAGALVALLAGIAKGFGWI